MKAPSPNARASEIAPRPWALPRRARIGLITLILLACDMHAGFRLEVGSPEVVAGRPDEQFIEVFVVNDGPAVWVASLDFAIQIGDGHGTTPKINSVNLVNGTAFDGNHTEQFPFAGNQPQSQYHVVAKAGSGAGTGPWLTSGSNKVATVGIVTAGAGPGDFLLRFSGSEFGDTDYVPDVADLSFQARLGTSAESVVVTLKPPPLPTAARLASFVAYRERQGSVTLQWQTLVEVEALAYRVERLDAPADWVRVGATLIPAVGQTRGADYTLRDPSAPTDGLLKYRLVEVDLRGVEHVLAEALVRTGVETRLVWSGERLALEVIGIPGGVAVVEEAEQVVGPWTPWSQAQLDQRGLVTVALDINAARPRQFLRAVILPIRARPEFDPSAVTQPED